MQHPLVSLAAPKISHDIIASIIESNEFNEAKAYFSAYPETSLLFNGGHSRAFIYCLIRALGLKRALEIGTFKAGTTEVFARALWANGDGHIDTVDPSGYPTITAAIGSWPDELQACCTFNNMNSMAFFHQCLLKPRKYDLAFVDGDHHHQVALFDIDSAASVLNPGGFLLIDNAEQPGVREAAIRFLRSHERWEFVGPQAAPRQHPVQAFADAIMSVPGTGFWLLRAPQSICLNDLVYAQLTPFAGTTVSGLKLKARGHVPDAGTFRYRTSVQGIPHFEKGLRPIEAVSVGEIDASKLVRCGENILLPFPARVDQIALEPRGSEYEVMVETYLQFMPGTDQSNEQFDLTELPTPY